MNYEIPVISSQPVPRRALRGAQGLHVPARLTELVGELGSFKVGRQTLVVVNSAELTHAALTEHVDAFVPVSAAGSCARRVLASGAVIKSGQFDGVHLGGAGRAVATALHAHLDAAAQFAERLFRKRKAGDQVDLDRDLAQLTEWIGVHRLLDLGDMPDVAGDIDAVLSEYRASPGSRRSAGRLGAIFERVAREQRTTEDPRRRRLVAALLSAVTGSGRHDPELALGTELTSALVLSLEAIRSVTHRVWQLAVDYPHVRVRVQDEIDATLQGQTPQHGDLRRLPYTLNVVREILRLHPPVVMFSRRLTRGLELGHYRLPAGAVVVFNNRRAQRCVGHYVAADAFNPDRYEGAGQAARLAFECLPFGEPATSVIHRYVLSLAHIVLASVAQRVSLVPNGARYTVATVRSEWSQRPPVDMLAERRARTWSARGGRAVPAGAPAAADDAPAAEPAAIKTNLILTCEALRAAM
jgi:cytochrome P450